MINFWGHAKGGVDGWGLYENSQFSHQQLAPLVGLDGLLGGLGPSYFKIGLATFYKSVEAVLEGGAGSMDILGLL